MTRVSVREKIDPAILTEQERAQLVRRLYSVHEEIFSGVEESEFAGYVVNSPAESTRLFLYHGPQDELVGYFAVHRFDRPLTDEPVVVFRAEAGLLPGYRQGHANLSFLLRMAAEYLVFHPTTRVYFLCTPVNPSSYALVARYMRTVYPRQGHRVPSDALQLMTRLADAFGSKQAPGHDVLVRQVGWITKSSDTEKEFWRSSNNPHIRFYVAMNPTFAEGNGLLTLVPLTITDTLASLSGVAVHGRRTRRSRRADGHHIPARGENGMRS